jgi:hypothetical protein
MVVQLGEISKLERQLQILEATTVELITQRDTLLDTVKIQKEQIDLAKDALKAQQQLAEVQDENCKKMVEAAKPSFWSRIGTHVTAMGIGTHARRLTKHEGTL